MTDFYEEFYISFSQPGAENGINCGYGEGKIILLTVQSAKN